MQEEGYTSNPNHHASSFGPHIYEQYEQVEGTVEPSGRPKNSPLFSPHRELWTNQTNFAQRQDEEAWVLALVAKRMS